jgi:hypothetical protein
MRLTVLYSARVGLLDLGSVGEWGG